MTGKKFLNMIMILLIFFSLVMIVVPVQSQEQVRIYVDMPAEGYIPGVPAEDFVSVDLYIESPLGWDNTTDGIVQYAISAKVDPTVLEPMGVQGAALGYFLYDFLGRYSYNWMGYTASLTPPPVVNKTAGTMKWISEGIYPDPPAGAGGSWKLCTLVLKSLSETAYSRIDLYYEVGVDAYYWTIGNVAHPVDIVDDGHYNPIPKGSLSGKVAEANSSIPHARISYVSGPTVFNDTSTDADGNYTITDLELGNYSVKASAVGYGDQTKNITLTEGLNTLNFELTSIAVQPGWIEGFVIDNTTKVAIAGATVIADGAYTTTNATGYYKIENLPPKDYYVTAGAVGFSPQSKTAIVTSEKGTTLNFTLEFVSPYIAVVPHGTMDSSLAPGMNFTISIYTDYTGDDVWGYEFSLTYSPLVLQGVEVVNGDLITTDKHSSARFIAGTFDNTVGKLSLTAGYFFFTQKPAPITSGPGILANVTFTVVGIGTSDITFGTEVAPWGLRGYAEGGWGDLFLIIDGKTEPARIQHGLFTNAQSIHDVAVINIEAPATAVAGGDYVTINVTVVNEGIYLEVVNLTVTIHNGTTEISTESFLFNLASGLFRVDSFSWNTAGLTPGTYTINATATTFNPDEHPDDNTKTKQIEIMITHDVAVLSIEAQDEATVGEIVPINVTVANKGSFYENASITVSYEDTLIDVILIDMLSTGESEIVEVRWNTTGSTQGLYMINAMATIDSDANITNNSSTKRIYLNLPPGAIVGTVTDALTGDPIQGVTINANGYSASTNADGHYNITDMPLGTYTITASKTEYESASQQNILVVAGENTTVNFTLRVSSNITISADPVNIRVGASTTLSGSIEPEGKGVAVTIWYRLSGEEEWTNLTTVATNEQSQYSDVWTPESAETYEVKASWPGDESLSYAESNVQSITVRETPAPGVPWYIYIAATGVAAIILAAMAFYFLKVKKPKST